MPLPTPPKQREHAVNFELFSLQKYSRNQPCGILYLFKTPSVYSLLPCCPPVAYLSNYSGSFCVFCQVTRSALAGSIFFFLLLTSPKRCTLNSSMAAPVDPDLAASAALLVYQPQPNSGFNSV